MKEFNFPPHFQALINEDGEVQIGDTIFLYYDKAMYFFPKEKSNLIKPLKDKKVSDKELKDNNCIKIPIKPFERKEVSISSNGRTEATPLPWYIGTNVGLAQWHEYNYGGHRYCISFELGHFYTWNSGGWGYSELYTKIQVEYRYCNFWGSCYFTPAGENADKILSVLNVTGGGFGGNFSFSGSDKTGQQLNNSQEFYQPLRTFNYTARCFGFLGLSLGVCEYIINTWTSDYACRVFPQYYGNPIPFGTGIGYYRTNLQL